MDRIYRVGIEQVPKRLTLNEQEHLRLTFIVMPGVSAEIPFEINIGKAGVNLEIYGLYLSPHSEQVKFDFTVRHLVGGSHSSQIFRGIVGGSARAEFDGLVYVAKDAQKTEAFQEATLLTGIAHRILHEFISHFAQHPSSKARLFIASKAGAKHLEYTFNGESVLDLFAQLKGKMQFNTSVSIMPDAFRDIL